MDCPTFDDSSSRTGMRSALLLFSWFLLPSSTTCPAVAVRRGFHTTARPSGKRPSNTYTGEWQQQSTLSDKGALLNAPRELGCACALLPSTQLTLPPVLLCECLTLTCPGM